MGTKPTKKATRSGPVPHREGGSCWLYMAKTTKVLVFLICGVCDTGLRKQRPRDVLNVPPKHQQAPRGGSRDDGRLRLREWCEGDTGDSPSIGIPNGGAESSTKAGVLHAPWSFLLRRSGRRWRARRRCRPDATLADGAFVTGVPSGGCKC